MYDLESYYTKLAVLYDLRLTFKKSGKENYSKEEILELFDQIAQEELNSTKNH